LRAPGTRRMDDVMTSKISGKAIAAGAAIGSAAVAAALLYASKRKDKDKQKAEQLPPIPSGEPPETD
jgi:Na+/H+-translocating membrane pyrophosphatase